MSMSVWILAIIAIVGALFVATRISSGVPSNTVELAASNSRARAKCPQVKAATRKITARSKVGSYIDSRGAIQHHGDGQEAFVPAKCASTAGTTATTNAGKAQTVICPAVAGALPRIPANASAEVKRNLALLNTQIAEANARLAKLFVQPQGGPNFVQNAILGPLKDKRVATLERIAIAIGRTANRPNNLAKLAPCKASQGGGAAATPGATQPGATAPAGTPAATQPGATQPAATVPPENPPAGLQVLAKDCSKSKLAPHDGFQNGNRCVSTAFGELAEAANNPSLLIQDAPTQVNAGQGFQIAVSTRNLVRDRFLAAGQGGYYVESSLLNDQGLVRGHFHTACRMLQGNQAQDPAPVPAFFVATEDGSGGAAPDTVRVTVAGLTTPGTAQCAVWAGDGSHRVPMMQRANQIPAFDVVRIQVQ
jgi:hypothetical protein